MKVVPLIVRFGSEEFRAGSDLSLEEFWARMLAPDSPIPATAAPSPGAFVETFEACFAEGAEAVVCPTIGSKLSATFQSATLAAETMAGHEIHVIDTGSTSMATGIPALLAAEMAAAGRSAADIAAAIRERLPDIDLFVAVDTLEYLKRGGRLSATQAALGTVLSFKPIITVRDGIVTMAERPRTRSKARERVVQLVTERPVERIAVVHTPTSSREEVAAFRDELIARAPGGIDPGRVSVSLLGASTAPHLGPGLMGAAFLRRH